MQETTRSRVLLGHIAPILLVGLRRQLSDDGVDVVGQQRTAAGLVAEAERLQPDVVLLDLDQVAGEDIAAQVQRVAPQTKVILWAPDETVMEVLDPASRDARLVATASGELRNELNERSTPTPRRDD